MALRPLEILFTLTVGRRILRTKIDPRAVKVKNLYTMLWNGHHINHVYNILNLKYEANL